jgi:hypothetical protein
VLGVPSTEPIALKLGQYLLILNIRYQRTRNDTSERIDHLFRVAIMSFIEWDWLQSLIICGEKPQLVSIPCLFQLPQVDT